MKTAGVFAPAGQVRRGEPAAEVMRARSNSAGESGAPCPAAILSHLPDRLNAAAGRRRTP